MPSEVHREEPARPPHVAMFMPDFRGGGAELMMTVLARALAASGRRVDMLVAQAEGPHRDACGPDVNVIDLGARRVAGATLPLVRYLRRERPEVLLSTLDSANVVALLARRLSATRTRLVLRQANSPSQLQAVGAKARFVARLIQRFASHADAIVAVSKGVAADMASFSSVAPERIHAVYNPVVDERISARACVCPRHPFFDGDGPPVVLAVGRLTRQKDVPTLLRAFERVRSTRPARLIVLGEGPDRGALEDDVARRGLGDAVSFPGFVENPFAYMKRASVFVLSSAWEGLPAVLIQAMACGCPVVATDCVSGPSEILERGRFGPLVDVGDDQGMAASILSVLEAPLSPAVLEARARAFSVDAAVAGYVRVLWPDDSQNDGAGSELGPLRAVHGPSGATS